MTKPDAHPFHYPDLAAVDAIVAELRRLPPLVTSWEIARLKSQIAEAQLGKRFLLQGGDCAESFSDCQFGIVANKLKILLQMSLIFVHAARKPVIHVGRFAGQYAKPRSRTVETRGSETLPSYFGDLVNRPEFSASARRLDPNLLLRGYHHAAVTLNFVRSLSAGGFADVHHPEYWDLAFFRNASVDPELRIEYEQTTRQLADALHFMEAWGEVSIEALTQTCFFTSHEGLNLYYESAQTRTVPHRTGYYDLTTHFPWIGERTRALDGAHVEFFRGIENPIGIKIGPTARPDEILRLLDVLNPMEEPGKITLITRMGAGRVCERLPIIVDAVRHAGRRVLWVCDPMHGNTHVTTSGVKTRAFKDIQRDLEATCDIHDALGSYLGGVHFELTGEDVTECTGGAAGITEETLHHNYNSACDPRLNYRQSLEIAFRIARRVTRST
jgi:3-deoxy-7-phosphoheptulonate synthase